MRDKENKNNSLSPIQAGLSLGSIGAMNWGPIDNTEPRQWRPSDAVPIQASETTENRILPPPALPPAVPMRWGRTFLGEDWGE